MGRYSLNTMLNKCTLGCLFLFLFGCQTKLEMIGQEHAKEVEKWQTLASYAGNELKYLGLTVTAGVQIKQHADQISYSIIKVQLNRDAGHDEVDLLSPTFAEKFACGTKCEKLGLYDPNFATLKTQLASFFYAEEGRFFEFYGKLTRLNVILEDYRVSSPDILNKYLTLLLNRKLVFNSLAAFIEHLEMHVTEEKLLAFTKSGFISPEIDRLSPVYFDDVIANLPGEWDFEEEIMADDNWQVAGTNMPNENWNLNTPTADELLLTQEINEISDISDISNIIKSPNNNITFEPAKLSNLQVGSLVCSFSDNSFGVVKQLDTNQATLKVIGQARIDIDGMRLYPHPGYLFSSSGSFHFVKGADNQSYPLTDIALCSIEHLKRGQKLA